MSPLTFGTPAFDDGEAIPVRHTCDGADASPPLSIGGVPADAASLAVTVVDPDAPNAPFVHWLLWNLPTEVSEVGADVRPVRRLEDLGGAYQGTNGFGDVGYRGPCPPESDDPHRYRFRLSALEASPSGEGGATLPDLVHELRSKRIASAEFTGYYER